MLFFYQIVLRQKQKQKQRRRRNFDHYQCNDLFLRRYFETLLLDLRCHLSRRRRRK